MGGGKRLLLAGGVRVTVLDTHLSSLAALRPICLLAIMAIIV